MRWSTVSHLALGILAIILCAVAVTALWVTLAPAHRPEEGGPYPFALTPELPRVTEQDRNTLKVVASVVGAAGYLNGVGVLTHGGTRSGAYGHMVFDSPVYPPGELTFVACEAPVEIPDFEEIRGLYVAVLDGHPTPLHLLPLDNTGELPSAHDLGVTNCDEHGHRH